MTRMLCLGRTSRTLLAFAAALVLCMPPGAAGQLVRIAKAESAPAPAAVHKSCCSGSASHDECVSGQAAANHVVRPACCQHAGSSKAPKAPGNSCCGGMGGCGCPCCPMMLIAAVPAAAFQWTSPVLEQDCLQISLVLSSRRDVPPTPPPNVA